jgi:hypothetical protein
LDSVYNKNLTLYFESKVIKTYGKTALWGTKQGVADEYPPMVTITIGLTTKINFPRWRMHLYPPFDISMA